MACMEHVCTDCGHMEFNNSHMIVCPKCRSCDIRSYWDEQGDLDREDDDDYTD